MRGWLALDIDGTLTVEVHTMPAEVVACLEKASKDGWKLVFITGRTYTLGHRPLQALDVPYRMGVQNGAALLQMPGRHLQHKTYLDLAVIRDLEVLGKEAGFNVILESGVENEDRCYFREGRHNAKEQEYFEFRQKLSGECWEAVESFEACDVDSFPTAKFYGTQLTPLAEIISSELGLNAPVIRDPFKEGQQICLVSHPNASKGALVKQLRSIHPGPVIAAGDDNNDLGMLQEADYAIAMGNAPDAVRDAANLIAAPAANLGIIEALNTAFLKDEG